MQIRAGDFSRLAFEASRFHHSRARRALPLLAALRHVFQEVHEGEGGSEKNPWKPACMNMVLCLLETFKIEGPVADHVLALRRPMRLNELVEHVGEGRVWTFEPGGCEDAHG